MKVNKKININIVKAWPSNDHLCKVLVQSVSEFINLYFYFSYQEYDNHKKLCRGPYKSHFCGYRVDNI